MQDIKELSIPDQDYQEGFQSEEESISDQEQQDYQSEEESTSS